MRIETTKIISQTFITVAKGVDIYKTAIETSFGTVWAKGDTTKDRSVLVNLVINEIGDTFVAAKDSKNGHFKAGQTVKRIAQSLEFKSFVPSVAEQFVAAAADRGLAVNFVVQG